LVSVDRLRAEFVKTHDGKSATVAFDLVAACADGIANAEFPAAQMSVEAAQAQLERGLDELLHGHDPRQVAFLKERLLPSAAIALRDALAADAEAWMRFHGWLIEDLRASQSDMAGTLDRATEVLARFEDPVVAMKALNDSLGPISEMTGRIDTRTERMVQQQDGIASGVRKVLAHLSKAETPPTTSPIFNNQGMQVGGSVYQAGQINVTTASESAVVPPQAPDAASADALDKTAFRNWLMQHFSRADLDLLCADVQQRLAREGHNVQVSLEVAGGDGLEQQCQRLIEYLDRRGHLDTLVRHARSKRPGAPFE
jgi:hypothetical protein